MTEDPWTAALAFMRRQLPGWSEESLRTLVHHPRRCAPSIADFIAVTGLPPQTAHTLWMKHEPTRRAAA